MFAEFDEKRKKRKEKENLMATVSQNLQKKATLVVSNLKESVTEEDLSELFGDIGNLRKVNMKGKGVAEIVFVKREDAEEAVEMYDQRLLVGRAMKCTLQKSTIEKSQTSQVGKSVIGNKKSIVYPTKLKA